MVYIQSNEDRTLAHHFDCSCALYGIMDIGEKFRLTSSDEVKSGLMDLRFKQNLFVGSVEFMQQVWERSSVIPQQLENSNRNHEITTVEMALKRISLGERLFVKPVKTKEFSASVFDSSYTSILKGLPLDTMVYLYEPFRSPIVSEWRCYVHKHKIIDSRHYAGDFRLQPNYHYGDKEVGNNERKKFPIAYTIDVAILENGETVTVEHNDMWSIGNYGIDNISYLHMLRERYFEIMLNQQG